MVPRAPLLCVLIQLSRPPAVHAGYGVCATTWALVGAVVAAESATTATVAAVLSIKAATINRGVRIDRNIRSPLIELRINWDRNSDVPRELVQPVAHWDSPPSPGSASPIRFPTPRSGIGVSRSSVKLLRSR